MIRGLCKKLSVHFTPLNSRWFTSRPIRCTSNEVQKPANTNKSRCQCLRLVVKTVIQQNELNKMSNPYLRTTHVRKLHTSPPAMNSSDDDNPDDIDEYYHSTLPSVQFMLSYLWVSSFTSVEFVLQDFLRGAVEAFYFLLNNLAAGNIEDIENVLTEDGATASRDLLVKMKAPDMTVERNELRVVSPQRMKHTVSGVDGNDEDQLSVVVGFLCSAPGEGGEEVFKMKRYFTLTFLASLDESGEQRSDWFVDNIKFSDKVSGKS